MKKLKMTATKTLTFQEGCEKYLEYCRQRNLREGTINHVDQEEFKRWRNDIGALLLLHKSINASLNDKPYDYKINKYCSNEGNIYTESLGSQAYQNNPKFKKFIEKYGLDFVPFDSFGRTEIEQRNKLVASLVKLVWNTNMFEFN